MGESERLPTGSSYSDQGDTVLAPGDFQSCGRRALSPMMEKTGSQFWGSYVVKIPLKWLGDPERSFLPFLPMAGASAPSLGPSLALPYAAESSRAPLLWGLGRAMEVWG